MSKLDDIRKALVGWTRSATGLTTILSHQSGPRPNKPYATVLMVTGLTRNGGFDEARSPLTGSNSGYSEIVGSRNFTASINVFGGGAHDYMKLLQDSTQKRDFTDFGFQRPRIVTLSILSVADSTAYSIKIDGEPLTFTSDVDATQIEIATGIMGSINDSPYTTVTAALSGSTVVITGTSGDDYLLEIVNSNLLEQTENQGALDIIPISDGGVVDLTSLLESKYEERAQCDYFFRSNNKFMENLEVIETVEIENLNTGDTFTVPE